MNSIFSVDNEISSHFYIVYVNLGLEKVLFKDWLHFNYSGMTASYSISVQPKSLFWFRFDTETETQIGRYFRPIL